VHAERFIFPLLKTRKKENRPCMLLKTILNRIHPIKGFVYGRIQMEGTTGQGVRAVVDIRHRMGSKGACSMCGKRSPGYDHLPTRLFDFIPLWNISVIFKYAPRRVSCPVHGIVVESLPWGNGKHHTTTAFQVFLSQWARLLSWQEVARRFGTTWDTVWGSIVSVVDYGLAHRDLSGIQSIGVDELAIGKGHTYVTLVYQIDAGVRRLLWIGKNRTAKTLLRFFQMFGTARSAIIHYVCTDMWKPYLKVIARKIPQALNILDRFHIMKKFGEAIDDVRRKEMQRLEDEGREAILTKSRWVLLKRPENLSGAQRGRLRELLRCNLRSVRAYLLREDFQHFWTYSSPTWASKFLDEWTRRAILSRIEPMKKIARMLKKHQSLILNWFAVHGKLSSGIIEALNNTAKLTIRKSYGFRRYETLKYALYHKPGELPVPKLTHEFF
jgi:transposase